MTRINWQGFTDKDSLTRISCWIFFSRVLSKENLIFLLPLLIVVSYTHIFNIFNNTDSHKDLGLLKEGYFEVRTSRRSPIVDISQYILKLYKICWIKIIMRVSNIICIVWYCIIPVYLYPFINFSNHMFVLQCPWF